MIPRLIRLAAGAALTWCVAAAALAPEIPLAASSAAVLVFALTVWQPGLGLIAAISLAPAGLLLAPPPIRAAELMAWSFLGSWLIAVWRPVGRLPRPLVYLAVLYAACALVSWIGLVMENAAGIQPAALPTFLLHSLPPDHVLFSSPEAETWVLLQTLAGLGVYVGGLALVAHDDRYRRWTAYALVGTCTALALATVVDVMRQWHANEFGWWYVLRYVRGERFSLHLADLNAAGSLYVLGGLIGAALAVTDRRRRLLWLAVVIVMLPAGWLTGSRTAALAALVAGIGVFAFAVWRVRVGLPRAAVAAAVMLVVLLAALSTGRAEERGSAGMSLRLRTAFLQTSARMWRSAPIFGVGVGRYHERSAEFMPDELRAIYPHENAHNYFVQQFAELGVVGGLAFVWLVTAALVAGWRTVRARPGDGVLTGLFAGTLGYLITCVPGHPLLVPEAAIPFWGALGSVAAAGATDGSASNATRRRALGAMIPVLLMASLGLHAFRYARPGSPPTDRGFHEFDRAEDGSRFRWMTRHGVTHVGPEPGILTVPVHAPAFLHRQRPWVVEVAVGGWVVERREVPPDRWLSMAIPVRQPAFRPFRRVDLRANQIWSPRHDRGNPDDDRPMSVMVGDIQWEAAGP